MFRFSPKASRSTRVSCAFSLPGAEGRRSRKAPFFFSTPAFITRPNQKALFFSNILCSSCFFSLPGAEVEEGEAEAVEQQGHPAQVLVDEAVAHAGQEGVEQGADQKALCGGGVGVGVGGESAQIKKPCVCVGGGGDRRFFGSCVLLFFACVGGK